MIIKRRVVIESPYSGDTTRNLLYLKRCMLDSLARNEAPLASHLLYTQVLDDTIPVQRELGMSAGFAWNIKADCVVVYTDYGISAGMTEGIKLAIVNEIPIEFRVIGVNDDY